MKYKIVFLTLLANIIFYNNSCAQLNPNVKVFRNIPVYEFFNSTSQSSIDLFQGLTVDANNAIRDIELADSSGFGIDKFYLRSGDGSQDDFALGQETKFIPFFQTRNNYSQAGFDTITRIDPGHSGNLVPADFYKYNTFSLGRSFTSNDLRVYGFWLKGKKISFGLPYEVFGIMYMKSIETLNIGGIPTYKLTIDIKINTHGENDFRENLVNIQTAGAETPAKYSLSQNYPNPFNPATNIKFEIIKSGFVSLKIYDAYGREVESLLNNFQLAGTYNISWDASQLPNGVYFYKLQTNDFVETKKMILVK